MKTTAPFTAILFCLLSTVPVDVRSVAQEQAPPNQQGPNQQGPNQQGPNQQGPRQPATGEEKATDANAAKPNVDVLTRYDLMFQEREPFVGTEAPVVDAWDENGKSIKAGGVPGKHTVLIFGCLT